MLYKLVQLYNRWINRKNGYYVEVYEKDMSPIRADNVGGDRWIVTYQNWELKTFANSGYEACEKLRKWIREIA